MKGKMKKIIPIVALAFIAIAVFYSMKSSKQSDSPVSIAQDMSSSSNVAKQKLIDQGDDILKILGLVKEIDLSVDIFSNPLFLSLSDFSVSLPRKEIGQRNPFSSSN